MGWSYSGHRGSANNKASGAVLSVSPNQQIPVGAVVVAVCLSDNLVNASATNNHVVADFLGNRWTKIGERTNAAAAGAGITLSLWITRLTADLTTTDVVVLGLTAAATAKAIGLYEYAVDADSTFVVAGIASSEQDGTQSPTVNLNGLANDQAYAFLGIVARENDTLNTYSQDSDYNDRTSFGTTGGTAATNVSAIVGDRLASLTGDTFAPTNLSASADVVTALIALKEIPVHTVKLISVGAVEGGWSVIYEFNGHRRGQTFGSQAMAVEYFEQNQLGEDEAVILALQTWKARDPNFSSFGAVQNKTMRINLQTNPVVEIA